MMLSAWQWDVVALGSGISNGMAVGSVVQWWELPGGHQDSPTTLGRQHWGSSHDVPTEFCKAKEVTQALASKVRPPGV